MPTFMYLMPKIGYAPYSAGVFLCRKGFLKYTTVSAPYLGGHESTTICGSRSGAIAAACWALTQVMGREDYKDRLLVCMINLEYLREQLRTLNQNGQERVRFYPTRMNIQATWVDEDILAALNALNDDGKSLLDKFCIPGDTFPEDLTNPTWKDRVIIREVPVVRFMAMPHLTRYRINEFMDELLAKVAQFA